VVSELKFSKGPADKRIKRGNREKTRKEVSVSNSQILVLRAFFYSKTKP
jgi:hypothetical protein